MKKQVYILATILLVFFAFYAVYYYANYRIRNLTVISRVEPDKSRIVWQPNTSALKDTSELVIPVMDFHLSESLPGLMNNREEKVTGIRRISLSRNAAFSALNRPEGSSKATITFGKPFLFFYNRKSNQRPYLLTWVTDPELLLSQARKGS